MTAFLHPTHRLPASSTRSRAGWVLGAPGSSLPPLVPLSRAGPRRIPSARMSQEEQSTHTPWAKAWPAPLMVPEVLLVACRPLLSLLMRRLISCILGNNFYLAHQSQLFQRSELLRRRLQCIHGYRNPRGSCRWEWKMAQLLWKTAWQVPQRSDKEFPRDPAIPLPRIYPGELKTYVLAKAYMRTFTAALFAIAKKCN